MKNKNEREMIIITGFPHENVVGVAKFLKKNGFHFGNPLDENTLENVQINEILINEILRLNKISASDCDTTTFKPFYKIRLPSKNIFKSWLENAFDDDYEKFAFISFSIPHIWPFVDEIYPNAKWIVVAPSDKIENTSNSDKFNWYKAKTNLICYFTKKYFLYKKDENTLQDLLDYCNQRHSLYDMSFEWFKKAERPLKPVKPL